MSDKHYWYGYLEAGEKSSHVLQDFRLNTGNAGTLYLYNLKRNEILEYKREIITPKLRPLGKQEQKLNEQLVSAYLEVRRTFQPRGERAAVIPSKGGRAVAAANDETLPGSSYQQRYSIEEEFVDESWLEEEA